MLWDTGKSERLEALLSERFEARGVLLVDGGTSALALSLRGALFDDGDRPVALPAYGCFDIATAAEAARSRVVFYDTDPGTLAPEPGSFARALGRDPSAVVVAHLFGIPVDIASLERLVRSRGALLIEDAAQGSGARLAGRPLGAFGDVAVLSFGRGKGVTGGGGGALLAASERGCRIVDSARATLAPSRAGTREMAMLVGQWAFGRPALYWLPASLPFLRLGETIYRPPHEPRWASHASRRVLMGTWPVAAEEEGRRRINAERLLRRVGPALQPVPPPAGAQPGYLRLPLLAAPHARSLAARAEARRLGIMPGYPIPLSRLPGISTLWENPDEPLPGAQRLAAELVTVPTHGGLGERDLRRLERWMDRMNGAPL